LTNSFQKLDQYLILGKTDGSAVEVIDQFGHDGATALRAGPAGEEALEFCDWKPSKSAAIGAESFTLYVDEREVYAKEIADALEADLQPFATAGLISRISKYDTNPASNPQPPQLTSEGPRFSHPQAVCNCASEKRRR
jgi:hypothetical protein